LNILIELRMCDDSASGPSRSTPGQRHSTREGLAFYFKQEVLSKRRAPSRYQVRAITADCALRLTVLLQHPRPLLFHGPERHAVHAAPIPVESFLIAMVRSSTLYTRQVSLYPIRISFNRPRHCRHTGSASLWKARSRFTS
jgi:hypothetical protein